MSQLVSAGMEQLGLFFKEPPERTVKSGGGLKQSCRMSIHQGSEEKKSPPQPEFVSSDLAGVCLWPSRNNRNTFPASGGFFWPFVHIHTPLWGEWHVEEGGRWLRASLSQHGESITPLRVLPPPHPLQTHFQPPDLPAPQPCHRPVNSSEIIHSHTREHVTRKVSREDTNYIKGRPGTEAVTEAFDPNCHVVTRAGKPQRE